MEGLATYISHRLNPSDPFAELLLDIPHNLIADTEAQMISIAQSLLHDLYSTDPAVYARYFVLRQTHNFPQRCGYYIGFLLAKKLSESYPLDVLIRLTEREFVPHFTSFLELIIQGNF